jgi:hypothetical protein
LSWFCSSILLNEFFLLKSCHHAFDGGIFRVGFFWDRLNVHTFNCHHRADRRVKGWLRNGWAVGWVYGGGGMGGGRKDGYKRGV